MRGCLERAKAHGLKFSIENHTHTMMPVTDSFFRLWDAIRDPAAALEILQAALALFRIPASQPFHHGLKKRELVQNEMISLQLLENTADGCVGPIFVHVPAGIGDQLDSLKAEASDDIDGLLGVRSRLEAVKVPTHAADFRPLFRGRLRRSDCRRSG